MTFDGERLDRWIGASVLLHGALFTFVVLSPRFFPALGSNWGSTSGGSGGITVKIAGSVSAVPLPTPIAVQPNAPANESPGLYKNEKPVPPPPPDKTAEKIPDTKAPKAAPTPKPPRAAPPSPKSSAVPEPPPSNAIPYGEGGRPALAYGQFATGAGEAGIGFGDAAFGNQYSTYVNAITRAISNNWLKSLVDARIQRAPRVYMSFDIAKDGTISNIEVKQGSGIPSLDRSAERAVRNSNPLPPLPADYRGSSVSVSFYFEYSR
jgi:periplasmic protein TonB